MPLPFVFVHLLLTRWAAERVNDWSWRPPPSPPQQRGNKLWPELVIGWKCTCLHWFVIGWKCTCPHRRQCLAFACLHLKRADWMFWVRQIFGAISPFSRWSSFVYRTLDVSQGAGPPYVMWRRLLQDWGDTSCCKLLFLQIIVAHKKKRRLSLDVHTGNAGECCVWNVTTPCRTWSVSDCYCYAKPRFVYRP